jgi:hypothetical protein
MKQIVSDLEIIIMHHKSAELFSPLCATARTSLWFRLRFMFHQKSEPQFPTDQAFHLISRMYATLAFRALLVSRRQTL